MSRHRSWNFTLYKMLTSPEYSKNEEELEAPEAFLYLRDNYQHGYTYLIVGLETCPSTDRMHLQCYIHLNNPRSMKWVKRYLNSESVHLEVCRGDSISNRNYCWKGSNTKGTKEPDPTAIYFAYGELPHQGKRNDLLITKEALENGANIRDVIRSTRNNQNIQYAFKWLTYCEEQRDAMPHISWFYGSTNTNKSKTAAEIAKRDFIDNTYWCTDTNGWWDGYDKHKLVIIDDMRADFCKFHTLLKILDRYPYKVEVKGGYRQLLATHIIITSSKHPEDMYRNRTNEDIKQLTRRICEIKKFGTYERVENEVLC